MTKSIATSEFQSEHKKLCNKYSTFKKDFNRFEKALKAVLPDVLPGTVTMSGLGQEVTIPVYKVKKFRCQCLGKGAKSGIRVIYARSECNSRILFIEIYHKNKKSEADRKRIKSVLSGVDDITDLQVEE